MPDSAIRGLNVQYIVRLREMAPLLTRLSMGVRRDAQTRMDPKTEVRTVASALTRQACPECGGVMHVEQLGGIKEFVCHVGHRLGLESMIADKTDVVERRIWAAMSQSEELVELLEQARQQGLSPLAGDALSLEIAARRQDIVNLRAVIYRNKSISSSD